MAATTTESFLELLRKSGVLDEGLLETQLHQLRSTGRLTEDPAKLAEQLIAAGLLTPFQSRQLLQGRWKGFQIGKYQVLTPIGAGGMGSVFLCEHRVMRRLVAVKVLSTRQATDPAVVLRFKREARASAVLDHPNIVRAYDIDQDDKYHFLVLEFVDGINLNELVARTGPLPTERACDYVRQAALGLDHAHAKGLVHRDMKPGNLLIDRAGVVKVLDMGLARFLRDQKDSLTRQYDPESVLGTADYLAPEQTEANREVDGRADIYSLGCTLYFLLGGKAPFEEGTTAEKILWHRFSTPKPLLDLRPDLPAPLLAVLEHMMNKDPDDRIQTGAEVAEALEPFCSPELSPPAATELPAWPLLVVNLLKQTQVEAPRTPAAARYRTPQPGSGPTRSGTPTPRNVGAALEASTEPMHGPITRVSSPVETARPEAEKATVSATRPAWARKQKRWALGGGVGLLALVVLAVVLFRPTPEKPPEIPPPPDSSAPVKVPPEGLVLAPSEARAHLGENCTVEMVVQTVGFSPSREGDIVFVFLNSLEDRTDPNNFVAVINKRGQKGFASKGVAEREGFRKELEKKRIRVNGKMVLYEKTNQPQIQVDDPAQITLIE